MTFQDEPAIPDRVPTPVIVLLIITVVILSLAGLLAVGLAAADVMGLMGARGTSFDLTLPDDGIGRVVWFQTAMMVVTMFLVWLFSILVVAAHAQGSQRQAAANAVVFVRVSIALIAARTFLGAVVPYLLTGEPTAGLAVLVTNLPLALAEIALLIAADHYFTAIRRNAAT